MSEFKQFIQSIKDDPVEFIMSMLFLGTISFLFYVSMWIFY